MVLYTCVFGTSFGGGPGPLAHPCGRAGKALDDAGHAYEHRTVKGGTVIAGSGTIAAWAKANPAG